MSWLKKEHWIEAIQEDFLVPEACGGFLIVFEKFSLPWSFFGDLKVFHSLSARP